jgi:hypothetical protein
LEIRVKEIHVEHWVQAKKRRNVEAQNNYPHILGDGVWPIPRVVEASNGAL